MRVDGRVDYQYIFDQSYTRVIERETFFDTFYQKFIESSPEVAAKFSSTDLKRQKRMLERSLGLMSMFHTDLGADEEMERIARVHDENHHDIGADFYERWMDCLIEAVRECDPRCDSDVELAWRMTLAPGITYMKFRYQGVP